MSSKTSKSQLTLEQRYAQDKTTEETNCYWRLLLQCLILLKLLVTKMSVMVILLY